MDFCVAQVLTCMTNNIFGMNVYVQSCTEDFSMEIENAAPAPLLYHYFLRNALLVPVLNKCL